MAKVVDNLKNWWKERKFVFSRYSKDARETQEPERSLLELPETARKKLVSGVENIGSNSADKEAIISTLNEAFERWQNSPSNTNNSIVVLSSPITAVSRILTETLQEWSQQKQVAIKLLPLKARPAQIETIESKLKHYFPQQSDSQETKKEEITVIPNLGWCFLRSLEGLKGIEYLQTQLFKNDKNRFWIIGGGQVGWQYLNSVCAIEAYCGEVFTLPAIEPEKLQVWFEPIVKELEINFDDPSIDKQLLEGDKDNKTNYFEKLADISEGVSTIAVQGFLKSIRYEKIDDEDDDDETSSEPKKLVAQVPKLPDIPELESVDQYILYSLLLHGDLTISTLAKSLGDAEAEVQPRIQLLRQEGLVEESDRVLKINPIYYPKIKRELAGNNFIINKE